MSTITLNREAAKFLVDVALSGASRDDVTPVICGAQVTVEDGKLRVVATDRYRIHTGLVDAKSIDGNVEVILPRAALEWLAKNRTYFGSYASASHVIRIIVDGEGGGTHALSIIVANDKSDDADCVTWNGRYVRGNYPPVMRLVETARASEPAAVTPNLNMAFLGSISRLARLSGYAQVKFTTSENPNKPAPVYFSIKDGDAVVAEALLQPQANPR